jgi:hypothetical protein
MVMFQISFPITCSVSLSWRKKGPEGPADAALKKKGKTHERRLLRSMMAS